MTFRVRFATMFTSLALGLSMAAGCAGDVRGSLSAQRLRVEHLTAPAGMDVAQPRLSWELASSSRGDRERAYQVVVGDDRDAVADGRGSLWDSGRVESSEPSDVVYGGAALPAHRQLYWSVRVWDAADRPSAWSEPAAFSTGFTADTPWSAAWIGYDAPLNAVRDREKPIEAAAWIMSAEDAVATAPAAARLYASDFDLPADAAIASAALHITADDDYRVAFNGVEVGHDDGRDSWRNVETFDVTAALKAGANQVRVRVGNTSEGATGLLATLVVTLADGRIIEHATGDGWRAASTVDDGWMTVALDAAPPARTLGTNGVDPWGKLRLQGVLVGPVPMMRKTFEVEKPVRRAVLYAAALGNADFYLNGTRVTDDRYGSGWTDFARRVYYRSYDVTDRVRPGANAIGALLADGWFSGYIGYSHARDHYGKHARLAIDLRIEYADGSVESIPSDGSWRARASATREADFLLGEAYDAREAIEGWASADLDDSGWAAVDVGTTEVQPVVQWHPSQPVRTYATFKPVSTNAFPSGVYVLDMGQNFAGVARLQLTNTTPGQRVTLRFAERLNPDGTIYTTNLRFARSTDTYICRGGATETWEPRFTFHGFQYVEISGLTSPPTADTITGVAFSSDTPIVTEFETSDPMLNRLHANILFTQRANFIDIPTDCPQRDERLGWTADAQVYLNAAILNADVQPFFSKWLVDLADAQRADGQLPAVAPLKVAPDDGGPAWADAGTIVPWMIYEAYGDRRLLERQYPSMKRFVEYCRERTGEDMRPPERFHAYGDWLSINADTPKDVIYMAYFAHSAKLTANAARVLGIEADARRYDELFERVKQAFHDAYIAPDGRIKGNTQSCYILAIAFDLVDGADRDAAARYLVEDIEARGGHLSTGFLGTKDLMLVLSEIGRHDVAFRLLHNETFPSWGFSIKHGATSIWERWDGWTPERGFQDPGMNSFAHYSFGAVYQWMVENIGGIHASTNAARTITIAPRIDPQLTWAKVGYHSPRGPIRSEWNVDGERLSLSVVVPPGVTATVIVPAAADASVTEGVEPLAEAAGIRVLGPRHGGVAVEVGGGTYQFASTIDRAAE